MAAGLTIQMVPVSRNLVQAIRSWIRFPSQPFALLDLQAGDGANILSLAEGTEATVYAVSAPPHTKACRRACVLAQGTGAIRGFRVVKGGLGDVRISHDAFSILWVNLTGVGDSVVAYLRRGGEFLRSGGLLVAIVPQPKLAEVARLVANWYSDVRVLRFPDEEFTAQQVVVLGVRRDTPNRDKTAEETLQGLADLPADFLQVLEPVEAPVYAPVQTPAVVPVFTSTILDAEEAEEMALHSPVWSKVGALFDPPKITIDGRPPTPLHSGHLSLLLASGAFNGVMGQGAGRHIVAGQVVKEIVVSTEETSEDEDDDSTAEKTVETEHFKVNVVLLTPDGSFRDLS